MNIRLKIIIEKLKDKIPCSIKKIAKKVLGQHTVEYLIDYSCRSFPVCNKYAMISYIPNALFDNACLHSNILEMRCIVESFQQLGYKLDIVDFRSLVKLDYAKYDVIFGFGKTFDDSCAAVDCKAKRILYATGSSFLFQNAEAKKRLNYAKEKYNSDLKSSIRIAEQTDARVFDNIDALITLGDGFASSTFEKLVKCARYSLPGLTFAASGGVLKEPQSRGRDFLWLGSMGFLHKGLDLLLEYFSKHPEYKLHVCAAMGGESDFVRLFNKELFHTKNIIIHGFMNVESEEYISVLNQCLFVIMPSCSEGCCTSVVNAMVNGNCIPIVTRNTGILQSINGAGIEIEDLNLNCISNAINKASNMKNDEIQYRMELIREASESIYSEKNYIKVLKNIIIDVTKQ